MDHNDEKTDIEKALSSFIGKFIIFNALIFVPISLLSQFFYSRHSILSMLFSGSGLIAIVAYLLAFSHYYLAWDTANVPRVFVAVFAIDVLLFCRPF